MLYVDASEVQSRFAELVERVLAGEEVRFRQAGKEIAIRRTDDELMAKLRQQEAEGKIKIPPHFGEWRPREPIPAIDGGFVGSVEAIIDERDERR